MSGPRMSGPTDQAPRSTAPPSTSPPARAPTARWPAPRSLRRALLVVHIVGAGAWIGLDVMLAVLVATALGSRDPGLVAAGYQALGLLGAPIVTSALLSLVSGVLLGLVTHWGLLRYRWVALKLGITVALAVLVVVLLQPGLAAAAEHGRRLLVDPAATADTSSLVFPPAVSGTMLVVAVALSVVKPRARLRRSR